MDTTGLDGRAGNGGQVRVVLADDHDLVRAGLRAVLSGTSGLEIVGEARNGREALELCGRTAPKLVLMDVRMPEMDGLTATHQIKVRWPRIGVLILTVHEDHNYVLEAIGFGVPGAAHHRSRAGDLTEREMEVLGLLSRGLSNKQIAEELFVSTGTAKNHVQHVIAKLGVSDRTQAVLRAFERGILFLRDNR